MERAVPNLCDAVFLLFLFSPSFLSSSSTIRKSHSFMSSCQLGPLVLSSLLTGNSDMRSFCAPTCSERKMQNLGGGMCVSVCRDELCVYVCVCVCVCVICLHLCFLLNLDPRLIISFLLPLLLRVISLPPSSTLLSLIV